MQSMRALRSYVARFANVAEGYKHALLRSKEVSQLQNKEF